MLVSSVIAVMAAVIITLSLKIAVMRKAAREIEEGFRSRTEEDTNTLIDISCRDRAMRSLADSINSQLRLLRQERRRFQQGDLELKEAVTNISHDLRTPSPPYAVIWSLQTGRKSLRSFSATSVR